MGRVEGKVVVITGAARGQGRSHAVRLAEEGADIIALDLCGEVPAVGYPQPGTEDLEETVRLVEKAGGRAFSAVVDVRDRAAVAAAVQAGVAELGGRLDVVIPNAGILPIGADKPTEAFTETVDINLAGVFNTVHAALPLLGEGGSVIVIGSMTGLQPGHGDVSQAGPGFAAYRYAKHALVEYVNTLSQVVAASGRRVNAVHPTNVNTPMLLNDDVYRTFRPDVEEPTREDVDPVFTGLHSMPIPFVSPEDVSHAVVYLASDESRYVTGLHLKVDAGALVKAGL